MRLSWVVSAALLAFTGPALGQEESWKGKMVILKGGQINFYDDGPAGKVVLGQLRHIMYKALDEKDARLRVRQGGVEGWIDKTEALPMDQALDFFSRMIENNPDQAYNYSRRAEIHRYNKDHDKAIKDLDQGIRLQPQESAWYNNRANSHAARHDYDKAIADYDQALKLKPNSNMYLRNRGMSHNGKKDYDKALADFNEALQLDPRDAATMSSRGSALAGKKQYAHAIGHFERALNIDPHWSPALNSWAWLLATCPDAKVRDGMKAIELARKGCEETDWKDPGVIDTLAAAHAEAGQFAQAVRYQEQALMDKHFSKNEDARRRLQLYREMKAYREE